MQDPKVSRTHQFLHPLKWGRWCLVGIALAQSGCGREFFREWADQDVTEAVFEKSRDPRFYLDTFTIEPPPLSRFNDPYDQDRPPAPPDDRAAEALAPVPQWPHHRLLAPVEGTGYLDLLNAGPRYTPPKQAAQPTGVDLLPDRLPPLPANGSDSPSPFRRPDGTQPPIDDPLRGVPGTISPSTTPSNPAPSAPSNTENSGTTTNPLTPNTIPGTFVPNAPAANPPVTPPSQPQARLNRAAPQVPRVTPVTSPKSVAQTGRPSEAQSTSKSVAAVAAPASRTGARNTPSTSSNSFRDPNIRQARTQAPAQPSTPQPAAPDLSPLDERLPVNLERDRLQDRPSGEQPAQIPAIPSAEEDPEGRQRAISRAVSGFASILVPGAVDFNESEAAGLPSDARPYIINPAQALQLALINNRPYQFRLENIYLASLTVTLERFRFEPQGIAGFSPTTATTAGLPFQNPQNQFLYRTAEAGGQVSTLNWGTVAGFGKLFMFGGRLVGAFANTTVFTFNQTNPDQPRVQSFLPLTYVQPFLRGGGRAVTLEPLTLAERNLVYEVRSFARFRQQFIPYILTATESVDTPGTADPSLGYLNVLQQSLIVENNRRNVAAFEQILKVYRRYAQNSAASGISQLQVDQIEQSLQDGRSALIASEAAYRNALDQYKIQLGLPPDLPIVLDRAPVAKIRNTFKALDFWLLKENHDPSELPGIINKLPALEVIDIDGLKLFEYAGDELRMAYGEPSRIEELNLAAERVALDNRLDLMNVRAQLYDSWRQFAVTANALKGIFTLNLSAFNSTVPNVNTNPFAFNSSANQVSLAMNAELPLVRVSERNAYITAKIQYQRQRRQLMFQEDNIKFTVRNELRQLVQLATNYEIQKRNLFYTLRARDNALQSIVAPPTQGDISASASGGAAGQATQTINLANFTQRVNGIQNALVQNWVQYQKFRLALYRDLGILPYDEWEAYYEFFPADTPREANTPGDPNGGTAAPGSPNPNPAQAQP